MEDVGNYYLISHLVLMTGLTDRTIRNYISSGILQGEKINGLWHFTAEQVEQFICHPLYSIFGLSFNLWLKVILLP